MVCRQGPLYITGCTTGVLGCQINTRVVLEKPVSLFLIAGYPPEIALITSHSLTFDLLI